MNSFGELQQRNNRGCLFSEASDCFVCEVLNVSKIGKNMQAEEQNVVLTFEQSLATLKAKGVNNLDIRY